MKQNLSIYNFQQPKDLDLQKVTQNGNVSRRNSAVAANGNAVPHSPTTETPVVLEQPEHEPLLKNTKKEKRISFRGK